MTNVIHETKMPQFVVERGVLDLFLIPNQIPNQNVWRMERGFDVLGNAIEYAEEQQRLNPCDQYRVIDTRVG